MTNAAAQATREEDPPIERVRGYICLFTILFDEFFAGPFSRWIERAKHARACAWVRLTEGLLRSVMLAEAAALVPQLPPAAAKKVAAAPRAPQTKKPAPQPVAGPDRPPVFKAWRRSDFSFAARQRATSVGSGPRSKPPPLVDITSLARRYEALWEAAENPAAHVRRLALRLQAIKARGVEVMLFRTPRVRSDVWANSCHQAHPDHERFLERNLYIRCEDANGALRGLFWNSS